MTFLLPLKLMDRNWDYDVPYYYEQVIDQKECNDICSWKDVEYCLNMPQFFDINVVSKHAIQKIDPPKSTLMGSTSLGGEGRLVSTIQGRSYIHY